MRHYLWKKIGNYARTVENTDRKVRCPRDSKATKRVNREGTTNCIKINLA